MRVAVHVKQTEGRGKAWQDPTSVFIKKRYQQVFCAAYSLAPCAREAPPPHINTIKRRSVWSMWPDMGATEGGFKVRCDWSVLLSVKKDVL